MMGAPSRAYMPASDPKQIIMATAEWITFRSVTTASPPPRIPMASTTKRTLVMSWVPTPVAAGSSRTRGPAQAPILAYEHAPAPLSPRPSVTWLRHAAPCHAPARRLAGMGTRAHPSARASAARAGRGRQPLPVPHASDLRGQPQLAVLDAQPVREPRPAVSARPSGPDCAALPAPMVAPRTGRDPVLGNDRIHPALHPRSLGGRRRR